MYTKCQVDQGKFKNLSTLCTVYTVFGKKGWNNNKGLLSAVFKNKTEAFVK